MQKLIHTLTILVLILALSACGPDATPQAAAPRINPTAILPASAIPATQATSSVTPFPTPTRAPSSTPLASPTAQPSLTNMPRPANIGIPKGATSTPVPEITGDGSYGCLNANVVKDMTFPDGTHVAPGQTFVKTWKFFNSGSCSWLGSTTIKFIKGDPMRPVPGITGQEIPVNNKADVSVTLIAPLTAGSYKTYFRLTDKSGNAFGPLVYASILVTSSAATITPVP